MDFNSIINILLLISCLVAIAYAVYVKIQSKIYTRERYAFAALSAIVTLAILGVHSITTVPVWSVFHSIWSHTPPATPHWSEHVLLVFFLMFAMYLINQSVYFWNGQISVDQKRREDIHNDRPWVLDGIAEFRRLIRRGPPHAVYQRADFSRSFSPVQCASDTLAWYENAKELIELRWRSHVFRDAKSYHPQAHTWIGLNNKTSIPVALYCTREEPSDEQISTCLRYVHRVTQHSHPEFIVASQDGRQSYSKIIDNTTIQIETRDSLLDNLVDFEDYFLEIERRFTKAPLPDSSFTVDKVYVPPMCSSKPQHISAAAPENDSPPVSFEEMILKWIDESSNRQIALLGEYGQGKSTVALKFVHDLIPGAKAGRNKIPILIELRGKSPSTLQPLEFLGAWASAYRIEPKSLMKLIAAGRIILIFEGFDEMAESGDIEARLNHFRALWRFCYPNATKLMITGRPNFFLDDHELQAALGIGGSGAMPYCDPLYLHFFEETQMASAMREIDTDTSAQIVALSRNDQKFKEVVSRPALLYMVALLWKTHFAKIQNIDSAIIIDLFIKHLYERQALKAGTDNTFMCLSMAEREYFQKGIAAYMAARGLKNQISVDQLHDAVAKLFNEIPQYLHKKARAQEPSVPTRPLTERLRGRLQPLDDIDTDVRTYGILVPDYSRPGAFRFPHKSFFELIYAKYAADQLVGDNEEENAAIRAATNANVSQIVDMPECLSFLGQLLTRRSSGRAIPPQRLQGLFDSIVLGGRFQLPAVVTRIILVEHMSRHFFGPDDGTTSSSSILKLIISRPSVLMWAFGIFSYFLLLTVRFFLGDHELLDKSRWFFISLAGVSQVLLYASIFLRNKMDLWTSVIASLGYTKMDISSVYGSTVADLIESAARKSRSAVTPPSLA